MSFSLLLGDGRLWFIMVLAAAVSLLTTLNVAARPAAVLTGRVAMAFTISSLFFMATRFANLFYAPLLARYVDQAVKTGKPEVLYGQIQWVIVGSAFGALGAALLLPTFVELYARGVRSMEYRQSMLRVLRRLAHPRSWITVLGSARPPSWMGVRLLALDGIPADFLVINVLATAVWTAGALCALLASAIVPAYAATAVLLSGLVNAFAAIAFSVWVDPKAALITDQALAGERPREHVTITAVHLSVGNVLGGMLGLLVLTPGTMLIVHAAQSIGQQGGNLATSLWVVVALNALVTLLASTTVVSRVSAAVTGRVATALAVYNLFFLVTRLAQQVYAPVLGSVADHVVETHQPLDALLVAFRWVIFGATGGVLLGWLLMPTFVEVYNRTIRALDRLGSIPALFLALLKPQTWPAVVGTLRRPSIMGVTLADLRSLPHGFLWGNILVVSVYTVGVMAAIYAGAELSDNLKRTATLLSSVVNGVATITLSLVVDPTSALITDQTVSGVRPLRHIYAMAVFLIGGMLLGTLLSQVLFWPAIRVIEGGARLLQAAF